MTILRSLRGLFRNLLRRDRADRDLDAEVRAHLDLLTEEKLRDGLPQPEARRAARIELGGLEQVKEEVRASRAGAWLEQLWQDARFGARQLRRNPGFAAVAVLTFSLGIGANTAVFSAANALLLRNLPIPDSDRVVFGLSMREGFDPYGISLLEYAAYRERSHSFERSGLAQLRSFNLLGRNEPERVPGAAAQTDFLATLGVAPVLGRAFTEADDQPGGEPVALIGYGLWKRRFAADPGVIGRPLDLNGRSATVIGVMPPSFDYPRNAEIWVPLQTSLYGQPLAERAAHENWMVARLLPGMSVARADAELKKIAAALEQGYPPVRRGWSVSVIPLRRELIFDVAGRVEKSLFALVGAVGLLLLICCANVASLLLARGVAREREVAVRRALGAGSWRMVRQLLTESLLLAMLGGLGGLFLAYAILPGLVAMNPIQTTGFADVLRNPHIEGWALVFLILVTLFTAVLSGLAPAVRVGASKDLMSVVLEGGQRSGRSAAGRRWLAGLVVCEIAVAVALLSGGGLLLKSFARLQHLNLGFRPENLLTVHIELPAEKYPGAAARISFIDRVLERTRRLPGVLSAGTTNDVPLTSIGAADAVFAVEGRPPANPSEVPTTSHRVVTPGYLETIGVTLIQGRLLDEHDRVESQPVAVLTEEFARQAWPGEDPIGKRVQRIRPGQARAPWMTVVGVLRNVKEDRDNFRVNRPVWYVPYSQQENALAFDLVARFQGDPASLAREIRQAILSVDPVQPVSTVQTMQESFADLLVTERFSAILMAALAAMGLLLTIIGLYGIMAYTVSRQTAEIGLRAALGARPAEIVRMILARGGALTGMGLAAGLVCAAFLNRLLSGILYSVKPNDPATFLVISLLLAMIALAACYLPARRASRVDPLVALRHE